MKSTQLETFQEGLERIKPSFLSKVEKTESCWIWKGSKSPSGYGKMKLRKKHGGFKGVHQISYMLFKGPLNGLWVLHKCDNSLCVNPDHLFLGTAKDNTRDCIEKGRFTNGENALRGENHPHAKINWHIVQEIREMKDNGSRIEALVKKFNLSKSQIWRIVNYQSWIPDAMKPTKLCA